MNTRKLLHMMFLGRAVARGPRYFAAYEANREGRKLAYRLTRPLYPRKRR